MSDRSQPPASDQGKQPMQNVPYEASLLKAFDKLTSQILIFLLAYVILLIGAATLAPGLMASYRVLLYIIPPLGAITWVWSERQRHRRRGGDKGIRARAVLAKDRAHVTAFEHPADLSAPSVPRSASAVIAQDDALVAGEYVNPTAKPADDAPHWDFLLELYKGLDEASQRELISQALTLSEKSHG